MMSKTIKIVVGITIVVLLIGLGVSNSKKSKSQNEEPIKISSLLSLTGDASAWGENAKKGIDLAVEEVNARGGINGKQIKMIYEDTAGDPKRAVLAFQRAEEIDRVTAVIGPLTQTETASVIPLIKKTGMPSIAPSFLPLQSRSNLDNPIFIWTDAENEASQMAEYVFNQGIRTIGVIGTLDAWEQTVTNSFADKFRNLGGLITSIEIVQPSASDMKLPVTKILATKPEAIYLGTYYQFVNSVKEIHNLGFKGKLYGIEIDDYLAKETSRWVTPLQFIAPDYYSDDFVTKFKNKYGSVPGIPAGQSYDSANILFSFLSKSLKRNDILQAMKDFKEYDGASGKIVISQDGRSHLPLAIFEIKNGEMKKVESLK